MILELLIASNFTIIKEEINWQDQPVLNLKRSWSGGFPNVSLCLTFFTFLGHLGLQVIHLYLHLPHHAVVLLALHSVHDDDDDDGQDQDPAPHADHDDVLQGQGQLRLLILQEAHKERQVFTDGHLW